MSQLSYIGDHEGVLHFMALILKRKTVLSRNSWQEKRREKTYRSTAAAAGLVDIFNDDDDVPHSTSIPHLHTAFLVCALCHKSEDSVETQINFWWNGRGALTPFNYSRQPALGREPVNAQQVNEIHLFFFSSVAS